MNVKSEIPLVALGGVVGAGVRSLFTELPLDTYQSLFIVNVFGAFLLGILFTYTTSRTLRLFLGTGVLGGFTTTSALALTSVTQFDNTPLASIGYLAATFYGGLWLFRLAERIHRHA